MTGPVPDRIGAYRIEAPLGRGGMGRVYGARAPNGTPVAVKVLDVPLATPDLTARFEREATIRIDHPNVVRVLDAGMDGETAFIVLELLEGESLDVRLRRGPLGAAEAIDIGIQACRGLSAAHALGIVHRDLKPSNLFVCRDGTVKLLDFGIARLVTRETRLTAQGAILGTPTYMSPEQTSADAVDERSDVWSLGAALYEALAGRPPFVRDSPLATMLAIVMDEPMPLSVCAPTAPAALVSAIERALAKGRHARWASAEDFARALASVDPTDVRSDGGGAPRAEVARPIARDDGEPATAVAPPSGLIRAGERRVVSVVLAVGVSDARAVAEAVQSRGGVCVQLVGDRALGLFGAETWEGDEASRAVAAALAARPAAARMSVASGRATASGSGGISGEVLRKAEEGAAVDVSGVTLDAATLRAAKLEIPVRPVRPGVWETATGSSGASHATATTLAAPEPPLVGREAELAQLRSALARVVEERCALLVTIEGPAGIGKTRLRRAMQRMIDEHPDPIVTLSARAEPLWRDTALWILAEAIRSRARAGAALHGWPRLDSSAPLDERRTAVKLLVREAIEDPRAAADHERFLAELLGVATSDDATIQAARADPQLMADRLRLAVQDYFAGLSATGPVVLILEDLQWADAVSLDVLSDLLERLAGSPLLVCATARPELAEARPNVFADVDRVRIEPRGLVASDAATLAAAVAGRALPPELVRRIVERTAGHPLFIEQIVLELEDRERLSEGGMGAAAEPELPLPLTVEAAVQSRLDHLPAAEKDACKRAAVLGRPFSAEELGALGVAHAELVLGSLLRRDLVSARGARGTTRRFQLRSSIVADVAYALLADDLRAELHRRAARHLAGIAGTDPEEIAGHHERCGESEQAAARYAQAAIVASRRGDAATVLRCSDRALALGAPADSAFDLRMARSEALRFLGRRADQEQELAEALACAPYPADRAHVLAERAMWLSLAGRPEEALAAARAAVEAVRDADDPSRFCTVHAKHVLALLYAGRPQEARAAFAAAEEAAAGASVHARALVASARAQLASASGDVGERQLAFAQAAALYREAGDLRREAGAECNLADAYNRVGAYEEAELALRKALESARRVGHRLVEGYALCNLGYALVMLGRVDEGLAALDEAEAVARSTSQTRLLLWARVYRARAKLARSPSGVIADIRDAIAEAERTGALAIAAVALAAGARAHLGAGEREEADALSARALARRDELGGIEEDEAEVFLARIEVLEALGKPDEARVVRERARARLHEIAAQIGDPEWRRRFMQDVPAHRALLAD